MGWSLTSHHESSWTEAACRVSLVFAEYSISAAAIAIFSLGFVILGSLCVLLSFGKKRDYLLRPASMFYAFAGRLGAPPKHWTGGTMSWGILRSTLMPTMGFGWGAFPRLHPHPGANLARPSATPGGLERDRAWRSVHSSP